MHVKCISYSNWRSEFECLVCHRVHMTTGVWDLHDLWALLTFHLTNRTI